MAKLVVTQWTFRYQMKDKGIIFFRMPLSLLEVEYFGYYSLSKSSIFFKMLKNVGNLPFLLSTESQLFDISFSKGCHSKTHWDFKMKPKPKKSRILNFQNMTEAHWYLQLFWVNKVWKSDVCDDRNFEKFGTSLSRYKWRSLWLRILRGAMLALIELKLVIWHHN